MFDPACGSGNFLVIAYRQMREIERRIIIRLQGGAGTVDNIIDIVNWPGERSVIPLINFYGIEIKSFACEIARLALLIAEFQCDVNYIGQKAARAMVLPLHDTGRIKHGNALRLDWLDVCPPPKPASAVDEDLGGPTGRLALDAAAEAECETYICGNPPYLGSTWQTQAQKGEIRELFRDKSSASGFLDYVSGWFIKAAEIANFTTSAFVSTNSICQGQSVAILWPVILQLGCRIHFAHTSFKWSNLASNKAGVTVVVVGLSKQSSGQVRLYQTDEQGVVQQREGACITPYLTLGMPIIVDKRRVPLSEIHDMEFGNKPSDGGNLLLEHAEVDLLGLTADQKSRFVRRIFGSGDFINGGSRHCVWIEHDYLAEAQAIPAIAERIDAVRCVRLASPDKGANALARRSHQLKLMRIGAHLTVIAARTSSENRPYLPCGIIDRSTTVTSEAFALYDAPIWNMALIASRLHLVWIATVCGKLKTDFRYSNTLGWNTFPVPPLTENQRAEQTHCAEDILLARESHFPATIADLYEPDAMPENLRAAHDKNDETLERIYIGRRFKNDTERLEKLFDMYAKMTAKADAGAKPKKTKKEGHT